MLIPVPPGEVIDRLTILEIKRERIADPLKLGFVEREYEALSAALAREAAIADGQALRAALKAVNLSLWDIEDELREHERRGDFGPRFVELARAVYHTNDKRAGLKAEINAKAQSPLSDVKSYASY
jgi:hypothetical protein